MMFLKRLYFRIVHGGFSWTFLNCKDDLLHRQSKSRSQVFTSPFLYKLHEINDILAKQFRLFTKVKITDNTKVFSDIQHSKMMNTEEKKVYSH